MTKTKVTKVNHAFSRGKPSGLGQCAIHLQRLLLTFQDITWDQISAPMGFDDELLAGWWLNVVYNGVIMG